MKKIKLTQGKVTLVDNEDFNLLNQYKWSASKKKKAYYVRGRIDGEMASMHRMIMNITDPKVWVDHKDRDGLNNQKSNLRICTPSQSAANRSSYGTSQYRGVFLLEIKNGTSVWVACIQRNGNYKRIGYFKNERDAAIAYNDAAKKYHGEFANLNKI